MIECRKLNDFLSADTLPAINEEFDDNTKAKEDISISQPVRTISINAANSDSDSEDDDDRPPGKLTNQSESSHKLRRLSLQQSMAMP